MFGLWLYLKLQELSNAVKETDDGLLGIPSRKYTTQHFPKFYPKDTGFRRHSVKEKYMEKRVCLQLSLGNIG